jgi:DNA-binding NarL/FixJ family response regulator
MKNRIKAILVSKQSLTKREAQIAELLCEGFYNKAIANRLAVRLCTVQKHLEHVYAKLECQQHEFDSRCAAISTLLKRGMVKFQADET